MAHSTFNQSVGCENREVFTASDTFVVTTCHKCGIRSGLPQDFYLRLQETKDTFYCPNGHAAVFRNSRADDLETKLIAERARSDRLKAAADYEYRQRKSIERSRSALKGQVTKVKNRVGNGVCPCCNRTFQNLLAHMKTQHPTFKNPPVTKD